MQAHRIMERPHMNKRQRATMVRITLEETVHSISCYQMQSHHLGDLHFFASVGETMDSCAKLLKDSKPRLRGIRE